MQIEAHVNHGIGVGKGSANTRYCPVMLFVEDIEGTRRSNKNHVSGARAHIVRAKFGGITTMIFPGIFSNRFPSRRLIRSNEQVSIWQVADALARTYIVKTTPIDRRPAPEVLEMLEGLQDLNVVSPIECHPEGQWCHQLLPHFPLRGCAKIT